MLGIRLREFRKKKGWKNKELADIIGISQGSLSDLENEKTTPSAETLLKLIRNTDINPIWLTTGNGEMYLRPWAGALPVDIKDIPVYNMKQWLEEFWNEASEDERAWLKVHFKKCFPDFEAWLLKKERGDEDEREGGRHTDAA